MTKNIPTLESFQKVIPKTSILIICILTIFSCNQIKNKNELIIEKFSNGIIKLKKLLYSEKDTTSFIFNEYFENGQLRRTGPMKDSIIYGLWEFYYENGNLMEGGSFIIDDSLNSGKWTYSYLMPLKDKNGKIISENDSIRSRYDWEIREKKNLHVCKSGFWEYYHENGILKSKGSYENGWQMGKWIVNSNSGQTILESYYEKSKPVQTWKYWYPNGQLMKIIQHTDSNALVIEAYDKSGNTKILKGNGIFFEPHPSDTTKSILATYKDGILNGQFTQYFDGGKIEEQGQFLKGKTDGTWYHYYYYYGLWLIRNYKNGIPHGYFYNFSAQGDTTQIRFFVNGLEHGVTKWFNGEKGIVTMSEPWIMGKRHGIRKYFDFYGEPELIQYFYNDTMIAVEKYSKGIISSKEIYDGANKEYNELKKTTH